LSVQVRKKLATLDAAREVVIAGVRLKGKAHALIDRAIALVLLAIFNALGLEEGWIDFAFEWESIGLTLPAPY